MRLLKEPLKNVRLDQVRAGRLYYVRLKTPLGLFYKLGFTTLGSVVERLAYKGTGDERYIDKVLCFIELDDAYDVEQTLHKHFRSRGAFHVRDPRLPFFENGQSELYAEDILKLDPAYTKDQYKETMRLISLEFARWNGVTEAEVQRRYEDEKDARELALAAASLYFKVAEWLGRIGAILGLAPKKAESFTEIDKLITAISLARLSIFPQMTPKERIARMRELNQRLLDQTAEEVQHPDKQCNGIKADIMKAIEAVKRRDLEAFEALVHIEATAFNLTLAMNVHLTLPSDYVIIAEACGLTSVVDAMDEIELNFENLDVAKHHDLLMKPVEMTWTEVLRYFVVHHRLWTQEIIMPDEPLYQVTAARDALSLSDYYGPRVYFGALGYQWEIANPPVFSGKDDAVEFSVFVTNTATGFKGAVEICVIRMPDSNKLVFTFDNLADLYESARQHPASPREVA